MGQKFRIDTTQEIEKVFKKVIKKEFGELKILKLLYVWRNVPKYEDGKTVIAEVFKLSNRDRDLWGYDVRIEVDRNNWSVMNKKKRLKVCYHELCHIKLIYEEGEEDEENETVKVDKEDRIMFEILDHDLSLKRFKSELKIFGLDKEEEKMRAFLNKVHKKFKEKT